MSGGICYCDKCKKPCQVYGSRWCSDCYYPGIGNPVICRDQAGISRLTQGTDHMKNKEPVSMTNSPTEEELNPIMQQFLADLLPEGFNWGDSLTPHIAFDILRAWDDLRDRGQKVRALYTKAEQAQETEQAAQDLNKGNPE